MVDVRHGKVAQLDSQEGADAVGAADYLVAVMLGSMGEPVSLRVLLKTLPGSSETDLSQTNVVPTGAKLLPNKGEMLKIVEPDATARYCTNVGGRWVWFGAVFTEVS